MDDDQLVSTLAGWAAADLTGDDGEAPSEAQRTRARKHLLDLPADERRATLSRFLRDRYLSDEAIAAGGGWEQAYDVMRWLATAMALRDEA